MNLIDFFLIIIILFGAYKGYRKGLINALGGVLGWVLSIVLAVLYLSNFKDFLDRQFYLTAKFGNLLGKYLPLPQRVQSNYEMQSTINGLPLPEFLREKLVEKLIYLHATGNGPDNLAQVIGYAISDYIVSAICFIILLLFVSFIIKLCLRILSRGVNATVLGGLNRFGGLFVGAGIYTIILSLFVGIFYPLLSAGSTPVGEGIRSSFLTAILLNIFSTVSTNILGYLNF